MFQQCLTSTVCPTAIHGAKQRCSAFLCFDGERVLAAALDLLEQLPSISLASTLLLLPLLPLPALLALPPPLWLFLVVVRSWSFGSRSSQGHPAASHWFIHCRGYMWQRSIPRQRTRSARRAVKLSVSPRWTDLQCTSACKK